MKGDARKRKLSAQNPPLAGLFANPLEILEYIRLNGWRCSAAQPNLRQISLLTGNFTGNFAYFACERLTLMREAPLLQALLEQFPAKPIRENNLKSRESTAASWELRNAVSASRDLR
jgi:hypothetical protein